MTPDTNATHLPADTVLAKIPARMPLYLLGRVTTRVDKDGPALYIHWADRAPARYPFSRICRVITSPRVAWTSRALMGCVEQHIPIVFLDAAGEPLAYLTATVENPSRLDGQIEEFVDRPDWPEQFDHWLRAERMRAIDAWLTQQSAAGHTVTQHDYLELVHMQIYQWEQAESSLQGQSIFNGALAALAADRIEKAGLKIRYIGYAGQTLDLASTLAKLLALRLALEMHGLGTTATGEPAALLRILHAFNDKLHEACRQILGRLHRRVKEINELWQ